MKNSLLLLLMISCFKIYACKCVNTEFNNLLQPIYNSNGVMTGGNSEGQLFSQYITHGHNHL